MLLSLSAPAFAEEAEEPERNLSLTLSPLHLPLLRLEAHAEYKPVDHVGVVGIAGYGRYPPF